MKVWKKYKRGLIIVPKKATEHLNLNGQDIYFIDEDQISLMILEEEQ